MTNFEGTERWTIKMNITISVGNRVPSTVLNFFFQKARLYRLTKTCKPGFWEHIFPPEMFLLGRLFTKTKEFTHGGLRSAPTM